VRSLRSHLLRLLLPSVALALAIGAVGAYRVSTDPGAAAYDQSLTSTAFALGERLRMLDGAVAFDLPTAAERMARADRFDQVFYMVRGPDGERIAGDPGLPRPPASSAPQDGVIAYGAVHGGRPLRLVEVRVPCGGRECTVTMGETTVKRQRLARDILASSALPVALLAVLALALVWFGVARGLRPLQELSAQIRSRSPRDLRPIEAGAVPEEARALVDGMNRLLGEVAEASRQQQRFLADAAHQLRTPLAGLQAHAELALALPVPADCRAELAQVHDATVRTARLANQLLALARAEAGARVADAPLRADVRRLVAESADEWVRRAMACQIDLGFELSDAVAQADPFLLREALANLVHNALEYTPAGGRVTVRAGRHAAPAGPGVLIEVEDDGPGIPSFERERVLERFYRIPGTAGTGSGLGLAIVREIVQAHGASLAINEGEEGRGCRVSMVFRGVD
jgi:two-component system sensor histidine kinase TctE